MSENAVQPAPGAEATPQALSPFKRRILFPLIVVVGSLLVLLVWTEILLAIIKPKASFAAWHAKSLTYLLDDDVDYKLEPRPYDWGQVNRFNFRGKEIPPEKAPGTFRILVTGGSAAFDLYKRDGETWPEQLAARLSEALGRKVEVLNAGTPGYTTWHVYRQLESKLLRWHPDMVLVYELFNDSMAFRWDDRDKIIRGWKVNARAQYLTFAAHPNALLDTLSVVFPRTVDFFRITCVNYLGGRALRRNSDWWWDRTWPGKVNPVGLGFYEENLTRIARLLRANGDIPFGIVTQATVIREKNTPEEIEQFAFTCRGMGPEETWKGYLAAWEIDRKVGRQEPNAFVIEAHSKIPASWDYYYDEVHLNRDGGRMLAGIVAEDLARRLTGKAAPPAGR